MVTFAVVVVYSLSVVLLTLYTLTEFHLLWLYARRDRAPIPLARVPAEHDLPMVTVQIPMYNEMYVAENVIDACAGLDYPRDRLEIQVCDDSTDESLAIARARVELWKSRGTDIVLVHRAIRTGFKAGALADATPHAKGEFIAIFDADFRPEPDFLRRTIPYFADEGVGFVQTRWGHLNREYSVFTRVQSFMLDMFYLIEQKGRAVAGYFIRFNGSGGVWRRACIDDSGGWSADTLAEDFDLCFRAQMKGWRGVYDDAIVAPAEIPVTMSDFRAQQHRWTKGKVQAIKKLLVPLLRTPMPLLAKLHALGDMLNIVAIPSILMISVLSVPLLWITAHDHRFERILQWLWFGLANVIVGPWLAMIVARHYGRTARGTITELRRNLFPLIAVALGVSVLQFAAMLDGFFGKKSVFHRTSKYNVVKQTDRWRGTRYAPRRVSPTVAIEALLPLYFGGALVMAFSYGSFALVPFHVFLVLGYGYVTALSLMRA